MKAIDKLKELKIQESKKQYPNAPAYAIPSPKYSDSSANGLTKCVIDWLLLNGHFAERHSNEGRTIDNRTTYTDVLGQRKTIGTVKRIPTTQTKGTSDIKAIINSRMVAIEIKYGKDKQSQAQIEYQKKVEAAKGIYLIVKDFETFYNDYLKLINL